MNHLLAIFSYQYKLKMFSLLIKQEKTQAWVDIGLLKKTNKTWMGQAQG